MSEMVKSGIFVAVAVIAGAIAAAFSPAPIRAPQEGVGEKLFPNFEDPTTAKSVEIVRFDGTDDQVRRMKIADRGGTWSIVSHKDYPADAEDAEQRIRDVALNLMDLEVLGIASDKTSDHEQFGVLEPAEGKSGNEEGTGLEVTVTAEGDAKLAQLIIGKPVKGAEGQRFVRRPGQSRVYVARIDPAQLSSNFEDWIKADLLDLNQFDIRGVTLKDYNFDQQLSISGGRLVAMPNLEQRFEIELAWDPEQSQWKLEQFQENQGGGLKASELLPSETLNTEKLNQLKSSVAELKIADVVSKPEGLSADLKLDEKVLSNAEVGQSLVEHGFFPVRVRQNGKSGLELFSSDGEVQVVDNKGVEYVLRFGRTAGIEEREGETKLNRYLLVSARLDEDALQKPELQPLPEAAADQASEKKPAEETEEESESAEPQSGEAASGEAEPAEAGEAGDAEQQADEAAAENGDAQQAERERIEKENQRKMDEYNEKLEEAKKRVEQLNERFAEWYYVIPEDVYKKIHLNRFDVITEKESDATDLEGFRSLEQGGLRKEPADTGAAPGGLPPGLQLPGQ